MGVLENGLVFSDERKARLYQEYNMTAQTVDQDVEALKTWVDKQAHLPDISVLNLDKWLEGILLLTKNSMERAKTAIDSFFTARCALPSLFCKRSLRDPDMRDSFKHVKIALMPGLTDEGHRVLLMKIDSPDASCYNMETHMRRCTMIVDLYLQHGVDFSGLHVVHDLEHIHLGHIAKFSLNLMRTMSLGMKAYPCRIPKITIVNTPYFLDKLLAIFRPFLSPKLMSRVSSYKDSSQLLDLLPARLVPREYGGQAPSLDELNEFWRLKMEESEDFFALCDSLKTNETKRMGKTKFTVTDYGQNGTFRQLSID